VRRREHRDVARANDALGDAAREHLRDAAAAVRAHDNEIDAVLCHEREDLVDRVADAQERLRRDAVFREPRREIFEVRFRLLDRVLAHADRGACRFGNDRDVGRHLTRQLDHVE
jgi:hypothetical protein